VATEQLTRSAGVCVGGFFPGGGYSGETKELDDLVQQAAELLAAAFGLAVEIRFNSNRKSGKAFVAAGRQSTPGLGGWLQPDGVLVVESYIPRKYARSPEALQICYWNGGNGESWQASADYDSRPHEDLAAGMTFLRANVNLPVKEGAAHV
jgi:hypothetical protein